ncbi:FAD/NAD(P)-binding domain-containing protein [Viridothelium virens]|uniref:FAD/NAD(P)-binding domain-containing protein n=1 Tax=Viridothelium virens TaxID=1048519 RepID=A0A6A6H3H0_VIRVR|nr:FAD/NAD(P)-binding domain-containing protein [Viridothelium virens]
MASIAVGYPTSNIVLPGSCQLQSASLPKDNLTNGPSGQTVNEHMSPLTIVAEWITKFNKLCNGNDETVEALFLKESYWRDLLCTSWDFRTVQGTDRISKFVGQPSKTAGVTKVDLFESPAHKVPQYGTIEDIEVVQAYLGLETLNGTGQGYVRLMRDTIDNGKWKAFTLFTYLESLGVHPEKAGTRRPTGHERDPNNERLSWKERRKVEQNFEDNREPIVLILGAGQGGLTLAARLKQLGVETLMIDKIARVGDNWRKRYHELVLHDSICFNHMPYLPFPQNWPRFIPKDKLADWFEYYAGIMELNIWTGAELEASKWDEDSRKWTVTIRIGEEMGIEHRTLHPKHIILVSGVAGEPHLPSNIPGLDSFQGTRLIHSSQFDGPEPNGSGKRAIIIGSSNSAHDIARDYYEHGYQTTMVQRSSTYVVTSDTLVDVMLKGLYEDDGIHPIEDADVMNFSIPHPVMKRLEVGRTAEMVRRDQRLLKGLTDAGFAVDSGLEGSDLWIKYLSCGGRYYIDVGCSQLITDKKIAVKQGVEVTVVGPHAIVLSDGSRLEADEMVFATGYGNMRENARKIFRDQLADRVGDVWGV